MTKQQTTEVKLLGQRIVLKTSEADPEVLQQVLQLVTLKISEAESRSRGAAPHQVALVALLDLAEEYIKAKKRTLDFKRQLDDKSNQLLSLVEAEFK
jgi:cell division protein ZapA (FtsZ GTPase activity inhibitor)